jgi:hypothetical protein
VSNAGNLTGTADTDEGISPGLLGLGIALVVLLLAGGIAYVLKRRDGWTFPLGGRAN